MNTTPTRRSIMQPFKRTLVTLIALALWLVTIAVALGACAYFGLAGLLVAIPFAIVANEAWDARENHMTPERRRQRQDERLNGGARDLHAHLYPPQRSGPTIGSPSPFRRYP